MSNIKFVIPTAINKRTVRTIIFPINPLPFGLLKYILFSVNKSFVVTELL